MAVASETLQKRNRLARFFGDPAVGLTGTLASIIGVLLAIYFYEAAVVRPDVTYYVNPIRASVVKAGVVSTLSVFHNNTKLESDVSAAQIAIWNRGKQSIRRGQVLKPITLKVANGTAILEATIRRSSRDIVELELDRSRLSEGIVTVWWNILENGDGGIIQLIYAAGPDTTIIGDGIVENQKKLSQAQFSGRIESPAEQYRSSARDKKIMMWLLLGIGSAMAVGLLFMRIYFPYGLTFRSVVDWLLVGQSVVFIAMGLYLLFFSRDIGPPFGFE